MIFITWFYFFFGLISNKQRSIVNNILSLFSIIDFLSGQVLIPNLRQIIELLSHYVFIGLLKFLMILLPVSHWLRIIVNLLTICWRSLFFLLLLLFTVKYVALPCLWWITIVIVAINCFSLPLSGHSKSIIFISLSGRVFIFSNILRNLRLFIILLVLLMFNPLC